jgi:tRNA pseudouridine38-40 synthase
VQGELEQVLARVLHSGPVAVTCAGRTDAGVHARGQVAHVDVPGPVDVDGALTRRLNAALPGDAVVRAVAAAPDGFDARFSALWRRYVYRVCDRPELLDPLHRGHVLSWRRPVSTAPMSAAAGALLGEHDFAAYCRPREGASTVRTLLRLEPLRAGALVEVTVVADAFCHSMVRALVGALVAVGEGRLPVDEPARALTTRARDPRVQVLPAQGLTLEEVGYPPDEQLAVRAAEARARRAPVPGERPAVGAEPPGARREPAS